MGCSEMTYDPLQFHVDFCLFAKNTTCQFHCMLLGYYLLHFNHSSTRPLVHRPLAIQASKVCRSNIFSVGLNQKSTSSNPNESTANYTQRNHKFMPFFRSIPKKVQNFTGSKNVWDHHSYLLIRHITMGNFVNNQGLHGWPRLGWKNGGEISPQKNGMAWKTMESLTITTIAPGFPFWG